MGVRDKTVLSVIIILVSLNALGNEHGSAISAHVEEQALRFTYSWPYTTADDMKPRGGTSQGPSTTLDRDDTQFQSLQATDIDKYELDRRAILAMAGPYRASFDFLETVAFVTPYERRRPYQSWGTEFVVVVDEKDDFISLQHVMVISFEPEKGSEPVTHVMKHWRQDWQYQDAELSVFVGDNIWSKITVPRRERKGKWSQSVYHVDDSPRYQGYGAWTHSSGFSSWTSNETWRPIPRRESSVRDDYDAIVGANIHTITPDGWVHEQNNRKVASGEKPIVKAKEIGLARYQRIVDFDWSPGLEFWQNTTQFWRVVRETWERKLATSNDLKIIQKVDDTFLFMRLFNLSSRYEQGDEEALREVMGIIDTHTQIVRGSVR